jgi:hypothetical protein
LEKNQLSLSDLLAALAAKSKKEVHLSPVINSTTVSLDELALFLGEMRIIIAECELVTVEDVIAHGVLDAATHCVARAVAHQDGSKLLLKRLKTYTS